MPFLPLVKTRTEAVRNISNYAAQFDPANFEALSPTHRDDLIQSLARSQALFGVKENGKYVFANAKYAASVVPVAGSNTTRGLTPVEYSFHRRNPNMGLNAGGGTKALAVFFGEPVPQNHPAWFEVEMFARKQGVDLTTHGSRQLYLLDLDAEVGKANLPFDGPQPASIIELVSVSAEPAPDALTDLEETVIDAILLMAESLTPEALAYLKTRVATL